MSNAKNTYISFAVTSNHGHTFARPVPLVEEVGVEGPEDGGGVAVEALDAEDGGLEMGGVLDSSWAGLPLVGMPRVRGRLGLGAGVARIEDSAEVLGCGDGGLDGGEGEGDLDAAASIRSLCRASSLSLSCTKT